MSSERWTILIATLGQRRDRFQRLLNCLTPQVSQARGAVSVLVYWDCGGTASLSEIRQWLVEEAAGQYVSFVDDDDLVAEDYVATILPLLDGVDQIGWQMQHYADGVPSKPTYHSLRYGRWSDDSNGYYRDISHLNPIRRELALQADFRLAIPEDVSWADQMRGKVKTEHYVDDIMYFYFASDGDSMWRPGSTYTHGIFKRPAFNSRYFRYHSASAE